MLTNEPIAGVIIFTLWAISFCIYLLPTIVAQRRGVEHINAIVALNILVGWTFFGWVAAFVWALADRPTGKARPGPWKLMGPGLTVSKEKQAMPPTETTS